MGKRNKNWKYWSKDPRNTNYSRNHKRFGFQYLQNLGWTHGEGIGKTQGSADEVKVKLHLDKKGLGHIKPKDSKWLENAFQFDSILSSLNSDQSSSSNTKTTFSPHASTSTLSSITKSANSKRKRTKDLDPSILNGIFGHLVVDPDNYSNNGGFLKRKGKRGINDYNPLSERETIDEILMHPPWLNKHFSFGGFMSQQDDTETNNS